MTPRRALIVLFAASGCAATAHTRPAASAPGAAGDPVSAPGAPTSTHSSPLPLDGPSTEPSGYSDVNTDNSLSSQGTVTATAPRLLATASGFRREVYRLGGRVFEERISYRAEPNDVPPRERSGATYRIKLLPRMLPDLLDWLGEHTTITAQDVTSIIAMESEGEAAIVRADVSARVAAIDGQLALDALDPTSRAALVTERARLIGATIADPAAMADNTRRVAVLEVRLEAPRRIDAFADARLLGHARGSLVGLGVLGGTRSNRVGVGLGVGGRSPVPTLEINGYAARTMNDKPGLSISVGIGSYSKIFGDGARASLNPYVGARAGYAHLDTSFVTIAGEVGVELVKLRGVLWTVSGRPVGMIGSSSQVAVELGSSLGLAF